MKKTIKIFLASSITEFEKERNELEVFIRRISDIYEQMYDISIKPIRCEAVDPYITDSRTQDIINETLKDTDLCIVLVYTRFGIFTHEEFNYALNLFKESNSKLPKIYVYFKKLESDKTLDQSVIDFMDELDNNLHYYWSNFSNIDTVKLRIALSLTAVNQGFSNLVLDGGKFSFGGNVINEISLDNVGEFKNHQELNELKTEYNQIDSKYYDILAKYKQDSSTYFEEYTDIVTKRKVLKDKIDSLEASIFNLSKQLVLDGSNGEMSNRQKAAYKAFEEGDLQKALDILDEDEMELDYRTRKQKLLEKHLAELQKNALEYLSELHTKIKILKSLEAYKSSTEKICEIYRKMLDVVYEEGVLFTMYNEYFDFIYDKYHNYAVPSFYEMMKQHSFEEYLKQALSLTPLEVSKEDLASYYIYDLIYKTEKINFEQPSYYKTISPELISNLYNNTLKELKTLKDSVESGNYEYTKKLFLGFSKLRDFLNIARNDEKSSEINKEYNSFCEKHKDDNNELLVKQFIDAFDKLYLYFGETKEEQLNNTKCVYNSILKLVEKDPVKYTLYAIKCSKAISRLMPKANIQFKDEFLYLDYIQKNNKERLLLEQEIKLFEERIKLLNAVIEKDPRTYLPVLNDEYSDLSYLYFKNYDYRAGEYYYLLSIESQEKLLDIYEDSELVKETVYQSLIVKYKKLILGAQTDLSSLSYYFGERNSLSPDNNLLKTPHLLRHNRYIEKVKKYRLKDIHALVIANKLNIDPENYVLQNFVHGYIWDFVDSYDDAINLLDSTVIKLWKDESIKNKKENLVYYFRQLTTSYGFISIKFNNKFDELLNKINEIYSNYEKNTQIDDLIDTMKCNYLEHICSNEQIKEEDLEIIDKYNIDLSKMYNPTDTCQKLGELYAKFKNQEKLEQMYQKYQEVNDSPYAFWDEFSILKLCVDNELVDLAGKYFNNFTEEKLSSILIYPDSYQSTIIKDVSKLIKKQDFINEIIKKQTKND